MGGTIGNHQFPFLTVSPVGMAQGVLWATETGSSFVFSKGLDGKGQESLGFKMVK